MARTRNFEETEVLQQAMLLFWEKGYEATSLQDLEHAMDLNRTSIYNAFGNKRALFQLTLKRYLTTVLSQFIDTLKHSSSLHKAIQGLFDDVIKLHFNSAHPGGCLVMLSLMENNLHDAKTRRILESAINKLKKVIQQRLEREQAENQLPSNTPCRILASQIMATISGMIVMAKAHTPKKELQHIAQASVASLLPNIKYTACA